MTTRTPQAKHPRSECWGYGHKFAEFGEAFNQMLRRDSEGYGTMVEQAGFIFKMTYYTRECPECKKLAQTELAKGLLRQRGQNNLKLSIESLQRIER